jgi:anthranilate/para-aminobenzoate synthase component II
VGQYTGQHGDRYVIINSLGKPLFYSLPQQFQRGRYHYIPTPP